jgi:hypothetical protein
MNKATALKFMRATGALADVVLGERAEDLSKRIAYSLWYGYQVSHGLLVRDRKINPGSAWPADKIG